MWLVGARRDDITGMDRTCIAVEAMPSYRPYGTITRLAEKHGVSRQTIYSIAAAAKGILSQSMEPGPHGPRPAPKAIWVDRDRLERSTVVLTRAGVSQRDIPLCMEGMLDTHLSPAWVNAELAKREEIAARVNRSWQPTVSETLSGDEIYSNGSPNLLVVGNDSLYIYALSRQATCDGETWACVLWDSPDSPQFASDAGIGLAAGAQQAQVKAHQLDWDHLLRPLWGQAARLEKQAYAALEAVEERAAQFEQAQTPRRLEKHLQAWEHLSREAEEKIARTDRFYQLAQQVDAQFALIDLESGRLRDPLAAAAALRTLGEQLGGWQGRIYNKLSSNLIHWADGLLAYHPVLQQALNPLIQRWGEPAIQALSRLWQIEADTKRRPLSLVQRQSQHILWEQSLDQALSLLDWEQLPQAWEALSQVLNRSWRGSMLAECVNSLLRPVLAGRKCSDQGCLELFRFLHNSHRFTRGKRAQRSPAELAGIQLPDDPLTLLGLAPKCQSNSPVL
jgi:hypothetical protein